MHRFNRILNLYERGLGKGNEWAQCHFNRYMDTKNTLSVLFPALECILSLVKAHGENARVGETYRVLTKAISPT